jgi:hypothetical protein
MDINKLNEGIKLQSEIKELYKVLDCSSGLKKEKYVLITCKHKEGEISSEFHLPKDIDEEVKVFISKTVSEKICELQDKFKNL